MTISLEEFRKYLQIDKHDLDEEITRNPSLVFEVAEASIKATAHRDALKEKLATIDALLDAEVREDFEKMDVKATEPMVKNNIQSNKKHELAFIAYSKAKEQADLWQALRESFKDRSYMLTNLVDLHSANYFESTSARGDANSDRFTYEKNRERIAEARAKRK